MTLRDQAVQAAAKAIWTERNAGADIGWGEMAWAELTAPDDWNQEALDALEEARAALDAALDVLCDEEALARVIVKGWKDAHSHEQTARAVVAHLKGEA